MHRSSVCCRCCWAPSGQSHVSSTSSSSQHRTRTPGTRGEPTGERWGQTGDVTALPSVLGCHTLARGARSCQDPAAVGAEPHQPLCLTAGLALLWLTRVPCRAVPQQTPGSCQAGTQHSSSSGLYYPGHKFRHSGSPHQVAKSTLKAPRGSLLRLSGQPLWLLTIWSTMAAHFTKNPRNFFAVSRQGLQVLEGNLQCS